MGTAGLLHPYSFAFSRMLYKFYLFTMYWLCWVFVAAQAFSLVAESEGLCLAVAVGFSLQWLLLLRSAGSRAPGLQWFVMRAQQLWFLRPGAQARWLWGTAQLLCGMWKLPDQGLNLSLLLWQVDSYPLRYQGSLSMLYK